jgi:hypothetical protein
MKLVIVNLLLLVGLVAADTTTIFGQNGMTVRVIDKNSGLSPAFIRKLVNVFFTIYPKEKKAYNSKAINTVNFIIDPDYDGVAETSDNEIRYSSKYFKSNPKDVDVVTHEAMHVVQFGKCLESIKNFFGKFGSLIFQILIRCRLGKSL